MLLHSRQPQLSGSLHQPHVFTPQTDSLHRTGRQQVQIDEPQTTPMQRMTADKKHHLIMRHRLNPRQIGEQ